VEVDCLAPLRSCALTSRWRSTSVDTNAFSRARRGGAWENRHRGRSQACRSRKAWRSAGACVAGGQAVTGRDEKIEEQPCASGRDRSPDGAERSDAQSGTHIRPTLPCIARSLRSGRAFARTRGLHAGYSGRKPARYQKIAEQPSALSVGNPKLRNNPRAAGSGR
jgi:hypothetical protein